MNVSRMELISPVHSYCNTGRVLSKIVKHQNENCTSITLALKDDEFLNVLVDP